MLNLGMPELILILVIALVILGPGKLPEMGKALGKSIKEFRQATSMDFESNVTASKEQDKDKVEEKKKEELKL